MIDSLIWLLVVSGGMGHTSPILLERFTDKAECLSAASQIQEASKAKPGMAYLYGVCVAVSKAKLAK